MSEKEQELSKEEQEAKVAEEAEQTKIAQAEAEAQRALDEKAALEDDIDYNSLMGNKDQQIPYKRFKDVNDAKKAAQEELEALKANVQDQINEAIAKDRLMRETPQAQTQQQSDEYLDLDTPDPKFVALEKQLEDQRQYINKMSEQLNATKRFTEQNVLESQLKEASKTFPYYNEQHVLSILKMNPKLSVLEACENSHKEFDTHAQNVFNKLIENKKHKKAEKVVTTRERLTNMKPEERPKSIKDAASKMRSMLKD